MSDTEKVIKAYKCCKNSFDRICEKCPYEKDCCHDGIPMFVIKKMVDLLKEQESIIESLKSDLRETLEVVSGRLNVVRCKDCKHRLECDYWIENGNDWFCADGERAE